MRHVKAQSSKLLEGTFTMRIACLAVALAGLAQAGEFHTGQAARAVIGQPSFSAREGGISANALALMRGRLYAAESNRILAFDVSNPCAVCGLTPVSVVNQSVMRGVSAVAVAGKVVVMADAASHRVLIWRSTTPSAGVIGAMQPDVVLGGDMVEPVSVAYDGQRLFVGDASQHRVLIWNALPSADNQPADVVLGQAYSATSAATVGTPAALVSDGANLFVADTENRRILVFSTGDIELAENDIVNSATLVPAPLAPGTLVTIRAGGAASDSETADPADSGAPLPTQLAGVEVYLNGVALPLLSVSPVEIQAQLPYDLGGGSSGSLYLRSLHSGGSVLVSSAAAVHFAPASPGIFAVGKMEPRNGLLLHTGNEQAEDGSPAKGAPVTSDNPATPGERVTVWANGLGFLGDEAALPVHATINGEPAEVVSARLPRGAVGVYEVVIALPARFAAGPEARLQLVQNSVPSNTVTFPVQVTQ
jgi:uncharacterized protein (TIGR03437 family)